MAISVALCTHNGARFVERQIESILTQTLLPTEIVVSDDASTDGTVEIIERTIAAWWAEGREPPLALHVLRNERPLGVTANFEQALTACTGDLVALSDQDDVWAPQKLQHVSDAFARMHGLLLAGTDARIVDESGRPSGSTLWQTLYVGETELKDVHEGRAVATLMRRNIVTGATVVVRRQLIERSVPFPAEWVHDEWLAVVAAMTGEIDLLSETLIDYRQHDSNQIGARTLGLAGKLQRLRTPRTERNSRLLARVAVLAERVVEFEPRPSDGDVAAVRESLEHERVRSSYPRRRLARLRPVLREVRTGRYRRCGLGAQDVLRDLVQPV